MKILRIIARLNIGGPARNAVLLTEGFSGRPLTPRTTRYIRARGRLTLSPEARGDFRWETVLVCGEVGEREGDMGYLARERGIEPVIVKELGRELSLRNDWRAFRKIYRIICREAPHIIHTHTAKAGTLGRLAGVVYKITRFGCTVKGEGCKLVHTFHGHALHSYFGRAKSFVFVWIEKILALFTDKIVTVSESLKNDLVGKFKIAPEKKFSVVELGFELGELLGLSFKGDTDCVNIGIVGRLVPVKNHKMLFRVARRLKEGFSTRSSRWTRSNSISRVRFVVIGDGELREELENYVKELGIEDIVEFKGWVRDLRRIYEDLDVVALTSLNEGTPVSIIEAMAAAKPVVATEVGGVSDIVQDGKNGYLVTPDDDGVFRDRLLDLVNDSGKRKRFGEYGRELARKRFLKERLIEDMDRLYNGILEKRGNIK